jgi:hypothetical protein
MEGRLFALGALILLAALCFKIDRVARKEPGSAHVVTWIDSGSKFPLLRGLVGVAVMTRRGCPSNIT